MLCRPFSLKGKELGGVKLPSSLGFWEMQLLENKVVGIKNQCLMPEPLCKKLWDTLPVFASRQILYARIY